MNCKYAFLALLSTLLVICVSSIPEHSLPGSGSLSEQIVSNLAHILAYALLTFLWLKSFAGTRLGKRHLVANSLILAGLIVFAVSDEIHQSFVPGRSAPCMDVGLDLVGILLGSVVSGLNSVVSHQIP